MTKLKRFLTEDDPVRRAEIAETIDPILLEICTYMPFAINHHWTPKQVDEEIPANYRPHWNNVELAFRQVRADAQKKAMESRG